MAATHAAALNTSFSSAVLSPASRHCVGSIVQQRTAPKFGASAGQGKNDAIRSWSSTRFQASSSPFNCAMGFSRCILRSATPAHTTQTLGGNLTQPLTGKPLFSHSGYHSFRRQFRRPSQKRINTVVSASLAGPATEQIASSLFQLATAFVVPFYTVMILAPQWHWTQKMMESDLTYFILGAGYLYLLCLSWTPETLGFMFATKYGLPELAGITRMFASTLTVASAWLHLLAVDLFAGRQVFLDGVKHNVETRHSLVLCLMMCPIGIFSHIITKALVLLARRIRDPVKGEVSDDLLSNCTQDPL